MLAPGLVSSQQITRRLSLWLDVKEEAVSQDLVLICHQKRWPGHPVAQDGNRQGKG